MQQKDGCPLWDPFTPEEKLQMLREYERDLQREAATVRKAMRRIGQAN